MEGFVQLTGRVRARDIAAHPAVEIGAGLRKSKMGPARMRTSTVLPLNEKTPAPQKEAMAQLREQACSALDFVLHEKLKPDLDSKNIIVRAVESINHLPPGTERLDLYWEAMLAYRRAGLGTYAGTLLRQTILRDLIELEGQRPEHLASYWRVEMFRRAAREMHDLGYAHRDIDWVLNEANKAVIGLDVDRQLEQSLLNARLGRELGLGQSAKQAYIFHRTIARDHLHDRPFQSIRVRLSARAEVAWTMHLAPALHSMAAKAGFLDEQSV